jgi:hypothetical protein
VTDWAHDLLVGGVVLVAVTIAQAFDAAVIAVAVGMAGGVVMTLKWTVKAIAAAVVEAMVSSSAHVAHTRRAVAEELDSRPMTNGWGPAAVQEIREEVAELRTQVTVLLEHDDSRDVAGRRYGPDEG